MGDLLGSPRVAPLFYTLLKLKEYLVVMSAFFHFLMEVLLFLCAFFGWASCKGEEAIGVGWDPRGVKGCRDGSGWVGMGRAGGGDALRGERRDNTMGAIIPALMHRIPSELRS